MSLNNLIENIIKNNKESGFDFTKSVQSNKFPYDDNERIHHIDTVEAVPITIAVSKWENLFDGVVNFKRRMFHFKTTNHLLYFLNEIIEKSETLQHHAKINIDHLNVEIILYTKEIDDITELDLKLAKYIDEVYADVNFIRAI